MTTEQAQFLANLPLQVLLLLALWKVYSDGRADRQAILDKLDKAEEENTAIKDRLTRIEVKMNIPPT